MFGNASNVMRLQALSEHIVVINSAKIADDLLEKRSHIYVPSCFSSFAGV